MGSQMSFGDLEPQGQRRKTRREELLERMDAVVPWDRWCALVEPSCHFQARGRHVRGAETMLRMYLLQAMFGLSDEGTEDAVLDSRAMQRFMRLDLMREQVPDATTLAKLRHALEREGLGRAMLRDLDAQLEEAGITWRPMARLIRSAGRRSSTPRTSWATARSTCVCRTSAAPMFGRCSGL